jgi:hypothetical protein
MFPTNCNIKGCGQFMDPYVDKVTKKVHCSSCDGELTHISPFTANQLLFFKQYRPKKIGAFLFKCQACKKEDTPLKQDKDYFCRSCKKSLNLTHSFKMMLDQNFKG